MTKFSTFSNLPFVGFDQVFSTVEKLVNTFNLPYDIRLTDETHAEVRIAVAGFSKEDIEVTKDKDTLVVTGKLASREQSEKSDYPQYLHRGISQRPFNFRLPIHEMYKVETVTLRDGLLTVSLHKEVPEEDKPVKFEIN